MYTPNVQDFGFYTGQVFKTWQVERRFSLFFIIRKFERLEYVG